MGGGTHTASFDGFLRAIALQDGDRVRSRWAQEPGSVGLGAGVQHCWLSLEDAMLCAAVCGLVWGGLRAAGAGYSAGKKGVVRYCTS